MTSAALWRSITERAALKALPSRDASLLALGCLALHVAAFVIITQSRRTCEWLLWQRYSAVAPQLERAMPPALASRDASLSWLEGLLSADALLSQMGKKRTT